MLIIISHYYTTVPHTIKTSMLLITAFHHETRHCYCNGIKFCPENNEDSLWTTSTKNLYTATENNHVTKFLSLAWFVIGIKFCDCLPIIINLTILTFSTCWMAHIPLCMHFHPAYIPVSDLTCTQYTCIHDVCVLCVFAV